DLLDRNFHGYLGRFTPFGTFAGERGLAADLDTASREVGGIGAVHAADRKYRGHSGQRHHQMARTSHATALPLVTFIEILCVIVMPRPVRDRCVGPLACSEALRRSRSARSYRAP